AKAHAWPSGPSVLHRGEAGFGPAAPAAIHGENVGVAHLLQIVRHQRGAESAPAVKHDGSRLARQGILNVALDDALAQVNGAGQMAFGPFAILSNINEGE